MQVLFILSLFMTLAFAQQHIISYPPDGAHVKRGSQLTVEVDRPNGLQGSTEVGMVIALQTCPNNPCGPPSQILGTVLFNGDYNPQLGTRPGYASQNFTVTIPSGDFYPKGRAQLGVDRFHMIGAGNSPVLWPNVDVNWIGGLASDELQGYVLNELC